MASIGKIKLIILAAFSMLIGGCATFVDPVSALAAIAKPVSALVKPVAALMETPPPSGVVEHADNSVESAILSRIPYLASGVKGTVGAVSFIVDDAFASASGLRCRHVTITESSPIGTTRGRIACNNSQNWFFSRDIFPTDSDSD
jgi:hypothetical protein